MFSPCLSLCVGWFSLGRLVSQAVHDLDIQCLVGNFLVSNNYGAEAALERVRETVVWRQTHGAAAARVGRDRDLAEAGMAI